MMDYFEVALNATLIVLGWAFMFIAATTKGRKQTNALLWSILILMAIRL